MGLSRALPRRDVPWLPSRPLGISDPEQMQTCPSPGELPQGDGRSPGSFGAVPRVGGTDLVLRCVLEQSDGHWASREGALGNVLNLFESL